MVPEIDFTEYNRQRSENVCVCVCVCVNTTCCYAQDWEYDRDELTYLRDIGEGQFGKVLLMKAKVDQIFTNKTAN